MALFLPLLAQLTIAVSAPDTVAVMEPIVLTVEMAALGTRPPRLTAPDFGRIGVGQTSQSTYVESGSGTSRVAARVFRSWTDAHSSPEPLRSFLPPERSRSSASMPRLRS